MMKKRIIAIILLFAVGLSSCGSNAVKYSPGDTWKIKLTDEFSLECHFEEINTERLVFTLNKVNREDTYNFAIKGLYENCRCSADQLLRCIAIS